jgi:hypothetical protein
MTIRTARPYNAAEFPGDYLAPVRALHAFVNEYMAPYLSHAFIHGSIADGTYRVGWSDVDTLFVMSLETRTNPGRLEAYKVLDREANRYLAAIDPLHHHGFIYRGIPGVCIAPDHAVSLLDGAESINMVDRTAEEALDYLESRRDVLARAVETGVFEHHSYRGEYLKAHWENAHNAMYQLKYLLDGVLLFPALLLEAMGRPTYKADSFAYMVAQQRWWDFLERCSLVRDEWPEREAHPYQGNAVPAWVRDIIGPDYLEESLEFLDACLGAAKTVTA